MIREFDINTDIKEVREILSESFNTEVSFKNYRRGFGNNIVYVMEVRGKIVSTATLVIVNKFIHDSGSMALIEDVATGSDSRGKGYASFLVKEIVKKAKEMDCYKVVLNCVDGLVPFYEKNGFRRDGILMRIDF